MCCNVEGNILEKAKQEAAADFENEGLSLRLLLLRKWLAASRNTEALIRTERSRGRSSHTQLQTFECRSND